MKNDTLASLLSGFDEIEPNHLAITLAPQGNSPLAPPHNIPGPAGIIAQRLARGLPLEPDEHPSWATVQHQEAAPGVEVVPAWRDALAALDVAAGM